MLLCCLEAVDVQATLLLVEVLLQVLCEGATAVVDNLDRLVVSGVQLVKLNIVVLDEPFLALLVSFFVLASFLSKSVKF